MSRRRIDVKKDGFSLNGLESLLPTEEISDSGLESTEVFVSALTDFENHPFKVEDNSDMEILTESVKNNGIINPLLVRPRQNGSYEIIAGHRRKRAAELCGMVKVPVYIMECDDDTATIIMVDSNIQREEILPSERAFSYKMKMEAKKRQGKRTDLNRDKGIINSAGEIGNENGDISARTVYRYISLTRLLPEVLDMVDNKTLTLNTGFSIAGLTDTVPKLQEWFLEFYHNDDLVPDAKICSLIISGVREGQEITKDFVKGLFHGTSKPSRLKLFFDTRKSEKIRSYFGEEASQDDIEDLIISLLDEWSRKAVKDKGGGIDGGNEE